MQIREKGRKVAIHCVFPMICGSGGSKSRLAKAAGAEPAGQRRDEKLHAVVARSTFPLLEVEMSKKCMPLWREAHLQVKMYKTHQVRTPFGSWDVKKVHAVVARSTFRIQNVQSTPAPDHFWKLRCRESARRCGAKHVSKSKCTKHTSSDHFWKLRRRKSAHFWSQKCKKLTGTEHFWMLRCAFAWQAQGIVDLVKSEENVRVLWHFQKRWQAWGIWRGSGCIFRGRRSTRDMFIRAVRRSGRWFPEKGCILEHQIFRFAEIILRDGCSTSYDLVSLFGGRRSSLDRWSRRIARRIGTRPSALHSTFSFSRTSRRIASFLMLSRSKNEEVLQNCFLFDVVKFKTLSCSKIEDVSLICCVSYVAKFKNWGSLAESLRFQACI